MNIYSDFLDRVLVVVKQLNLKQSDGKAPCFGRIAIEPPRDPQHGELATNAALVLSKLIGSNPRELADSIATKMRQDPDVKHVDVAGPGFINIKLNHNYWIRVLENVLRNGTNYGTNQRGGGRKVNVEFVSTNPTGPLHVGHCRGAVFGDALANLLNYVGYNVVREYYTNDAGEQVSKLAQAVFLRYREALGEDIGEIPPELYPGDYLKPVGTEMARKFDTSLLDMDRKEWEPIVKKEAINAMMDLIRGDLELLDIRHDIFFSEQSLHDQSDGGISKIENMLKEFEERGLVYHGKLPPPKGQLPEDWEDREQLLFRATEFGDDIDRPLKKSDGSYTYFAADVAYFQSKFDREFSEMIYVLGADHSGYVKRLEAVGMAISKGKSSVIVRVCQLVNLIRKGKLVSMSKRAGSFVKLRDLVAEIGKDAIRFMMLYRKNDAVLDFDFEKVSEQSKDNPVFYVQYAHARCASIFREVAHVFPDLDVSDASIATSTLTLLSDHGEMELIAKLAAWPRVVDSAAETHEPHRIAFYLYELASIFHTHWNRGKDQASLRIVVKNDSELTHARIALIRAVSLVLANGLCILGVNAPEEMR